MFSFSIAAEMRDVRLFNRSLACAQIFMISLYLSIGITVYYYSGQYVASPALGSAGVLLKRVAYGVSLVVSGFGSSSSAFPRRSPFRP